MRPNKHTMRSSRAGLRRIWGAGDARPTQPDACTPWLAWAVASALCLTLPTDAGAMDGPVARLAERSHVTIMVPPGPDGVQLAECGECSESCPLYLAAVTASGGVCVYCPDINAFITYDKNNTLSPIMRLPAPSDFDTQTPSDMALDPDGNVYVATETSNMSAHFIVNVYSVAEGNWSRDTLNVDGLSLKRIGNHDLPTRGTLRIDYVAGVGAVLYSSTNAAAPKVLVARAGKVLPAQGRRVLATAGVEAVQFATRSGNTQLPGNEAVWSPPAPIKGDPLGRDAAGNYYTLTLPPGVGIALNRFDPQGHLMATGVVPMRKTIRRVRGKGPYLVMADGTVECVRVLSSGVTVIEMVVAP